MNRRTQPIRFPRPAARGRGAFTLIELILVMTLLAVSVSLIVPRLANFFRGRTLDSETRHLLALIHHGQSRAVSAGVPVTLWLDPRTQAYGLEEEPGYVEQDSRALEFKLDSDLQFVVVAEQSAAPQPASPMVAGDQRGDLPKIRFLPDGSIAETSPRTVRLVSRDGSALALNRSRDRTQYETQSPTNQWNDARW